jgi:peptidoglycan/LPS O-acetylase OafA/YrhL
MEARAAALDITGRVQEAPAPPRAAADRAGHGRIDDIEMLRGFAVIYVLIEHVRLNLFTWIYGPETRLYSYFGFHTGVDLFFAISGFVIARSLLPSLARAETRTAFMNATLAFWIRRAWRLMPSAWLWLGVILAAAIFFNRSGAFGPFRANFEGAIAAVLDVANFRIIEIYGRFDPGAAFPYWSLSLEEQFYFLLPLMVLASGRKLPWVLGAAVLAQAFLVRSGASATRLTLVLNQTRSDGLLLGVLLAIWSQRPSYRLFEPTALKERPALRILVLAILLIALAAIGSDHLHIVSFPFGIVAVISASLVWIASYDRAYLFPDGWIKAAFLWIGSRSYALYLIHIPAYRAAREIWFRLEPKGTMFGPDYTLRLGVTAFVLLVVLAELNYRLVEMPLRRKGARIATRIAQRTA